MAWDSETYQKEPPLTELASSFAPGATNVLEGPRRVATFAAIASTPEPPPALVGAAELPPAEAVGAVDDEDDEGCDAAFDEGCDAACDAACDAGIDEVGDVAGAEDEDEQAVAASVVSVTVAST